MTAVCFSITGSALADQYDDQIANLKTQASQAQATANGYASQANDAQAKVNQLDAQIGSLRAQIALNQAQYNQVQAEIAANQAQLTSEKSALGANLKSMYLNSDVTPLEMIASSSNLSDYFNQQQYQDSIKDKIQTAMSSILTLQNQLASQQKQVGAILASENDQNQQLAVAQSQASQLLALASQNEAAADAQVRSANSQINSVRAAQAASFAAIRYTSGSSAGNDGTLQFRNLSFGSNCGGGYPSGLCSMGTDDTVDQWGMYNRECVSYTAYRVAASGRTMPSNWGGRGNATQWPSDAAGAGISESNTPKAGDVAIAPASMIGGVGHAMYVESVESGGWVHVSQYNWWPSENGPYGLYSEMDLKVVPGIVFIHF